MHGSRGVSSDLGGMAGVLAQLGVGGRGCEGLSLCSPLSRRTKLRACVASAVERMRNKMDSRVTVHHLPIWSRHLPLEIYFSL